MRLRTVIAMSGLVTAVTLTGDASAAPVTVRDVVGDANGVNGQGYVAGVPGGNTQTAVSLASYDITSVTVSSTFTGRGSARTPKDLVVTLELVGKPVRNGVTYYVHTGPIGQCDNGIMIEYTAELEGPWYSRVRTCPAGDYELWGGFPLKMPAFGERTVTWTIPYERLTSMPAATLRVGDSLPGLGADTRLASVAAYLPVVDELTSTASYRLGT